MQGSFKALLAFSVIGLAAWTASAAAPASPQGVITAKKFLNIGAGAAVSDLTGNARFPDSPDTVAYPGYFELNATGDISTPAPDTVDSYGAQVIGYFYPPATGDYVFYIASDDGGSLYLSTDDTPANKKLIAQEAGWVGIADGCGVEVAAARRDAGEDVRMPQPNEVHWEPAAGKARDHHVLPVKVVLVRQQAEYRQDPPLVLQHVRNRPGSQDAVCAD